MVQVLRYLRLNHISGDKRAAGAIKKASHSGDELAESKEKIEDKKEKEQLQQH